MENNAAMCIKQCGTGATPTTGSKPQGERQDRPFSATFVKLAPGRAFFLVVDTRDIPGRCPLGDRLQRAVHLLAPAMRLCLVSAAINPLSGCVVLAKSSTSEFSFVCTAMSSLKYLSEVTVGTPDFQKIEPCQDGHVLYEDLVSRRLLFEHLVVLDVVAVRENAVTNFCRMKCSLDRVHFYHALHPRLVLDPCHLLILLAIALGL